MASRVIGLGAGGVHVDRRTVAVGP